MRILLVGGGGREHALAWKLRQSPRVDRLFCAPGNAGIAALAECVETPADDVEGLLTLARKERIDLTVVGPEAPLCAGIVDRFREGGFRVFGPDKEAAELEGSKVFCKNLLRRHAIPTADFRVFQQARDAYSYLRSAAYPLVVKADGLAQGKGVSICATPAEAETAIRAMMEEKVFGAAGNRIIIEECLVGPEVSVLCFTDGQSILMLEGAQDHKRLEDGDRGPNTGGMGAFSPAPALDPHTRGIIEEDILVRVVHALRVENRPFKGILYAGLMLTRNGPRVLEFNVRFGDPEAQVLLTRMRCDLVSLMEATLEGKLDQVDVTWDARPAVCVVLASGGYPGKTEKGVAIEGLTDAVLAPDVWVFHAGTARARDGRVVTTGGRVLGVTALGKDLAEARDRAYQAAAKISFAGATFRTDIARRGK
ncbi:MAG: phosphoribosylamine--glycine ligase [Planctomycetes bacterium]|nr:phosphoribosylamine--glycine ligase [Planctomycetota bacterium]